MTLASILVPGLIWGVLVLGLLAVALVTARKHWRKLDAERAAALFPVRLLREQGDLIDELLGTPVPEDLRELMMKAQQEYLSYTHSLKGKR